MLLLSLSGITPPYPVVRPGLFPYWYEWALLVMLSGLLLFELTNPSDKSGLGFIKLLVLLFGMLGVGVHVGNYTNEFLFFCGMNTLTLELLIQQNSDISCVEFPLHHLTLIFI